MRDVMKNILLILALIIMVGCEDGKKDVTGNENIVEPTIEIVNPANGSTVSGNITIQSTYTGENDLSTVTYYVNSNVLEEKFTDLLTCVWNTTEWTNGAFELMAYGLTTSDEYITSEIISGTIYNEQPADALIVFDTSVWSPDYRGYKYSIHRNWNVCGGGSNDYYCSLNFSVQVKNIGGLPANNVRVSFNVVVDNVINGSPTSGTSGFGYYTNIGTIQPGESEYGFVSTQYSCNYGPGNSYGSPSCFENITLDNVAINVTWN